MSDEKKIKQINLNGTVYKIGGEGSGSGSSVLEKDLTTNVTVGGVASGTAYAKGTALETIITNMLYTYKKPTATISASSTAREVGDTSTITITYKGTNSANSKISKIELLLDGDVLETKTSAGSYTYSYTPVTDSPDLGFSVRVYDEENMGSTIADESQVDVKFYYKYYYGTADAVPTSIPTSGGSFWTGSANLKSSLTWDKKCFYIFVPKSTASATVITANKETITVDIKTGFIGKDAAGSDVKYTLVYKAADVAPNVGFDTLTVK